MDVIDQDSLIYGRRTRNSALSITVTAKDLVI